MLDERNIAFKHLALTKENYIDVLKPLLTAGGKRGLVINLSVDVSSVAIIRLCKEIGALYIDTVVEPWPGFYTDPRLSVSQRSNYALRESLLDLRRALPGGPTAVSTCGANPGMVSWFVKQALVNLAEASGVPVDENAPREGWAKLAQTLGVKGHPHRRTRYPAGQIAQAQGRLRQYLVGRRLHFGRLAARRTRLGHA